MACGTGGDILVVHWAFGPWVEVPLPPGTIHGSVCKDLCTAWQCPPTGTFLAVCVCLSYDGETCVYSALVY